MVPEHVRDAERPSLTSRNASTGHSTSDSAPLAPSDPGIFPLLVFSVQFAIVPLMFTCIPRPRLTSRTPCRRCVRQKDVFALLALPSCHQQFAHGTICTTVPKAERPFAVSIPTPVQRQKKLERKRWTCTLLVDSPVSLESELAVLSEAAVVHSSLRVTPAMAASNFAWIDREVNSIC